MTLTMGVDVVPTLGHGIHRAETGKSGMVLGLCDRTET